MTLEDWQQRVVDEKADLDGRIQRLRVALAQPGDGLMDRRLMLEQEALMSKLSSVLRGRIEGFSRRPIDAGGGRTTYPDGMTVAQLRELVQTWPLVRQNGRPTLVVSPLGAPFTNASSQNPSRGASDLELGL